MSEGFVPVAPLREAYLRAVSSGESERAIATRMGWCGSDGHVDTRRLHRTLGLKPMANGYTNKRVAYRNAVLLAKALGLDPIDAGV
jgi:hypothetical protein